MSKQVGISGKSAIIFGGSSGINLAIARHFVLAGARVFVVSRSEARVSEAVAFLKQSGEAEGAAADVRDFDAVSGVARLANQTFGPIDVLVSGAAGNFLANAEVLSSNGFRTVIEIDLVGTFNAARACFEHLRVPGASIINITAPQAIKPMRGQSHACAAKAGVNMLTKCLALEWGPKGVRVNAISPGPIENTEGMRRLAPDEEALAQVRDAMPLRRLGTVEDIATAAEYLASEASQYITGTVLDVDGGLVLGSGTMT